MIPELCDDVIELILHHKNAMIIQKKWRKHKIHIIMRYERWNRYKKNRWYARRHAYSCNNMDYRLSDLQK